MSFGDEGKGKVVIDLLRSVLNTLYSACVRYNGGPNAGHTIFIDDEKYVLHQVPSGILVPHISNLIGHGVWVNPTPLLREMNGLMDMGIVINKTRLSVDPAAHVVLPTHVMMDILSESAHAKLGTEIGSTKQGMMPVAVSKYGRESVRIQDIRDGNGKLEELISRHIEFIQRNYRSLTHEEFDKLHEDVTELKASVHALESLVTFEQSIVFIARMLQKGNVLGEGAQGYGLDVDHGTYPFVTSSNSGADAFIAGTSVPLQWLDGEHIFGVAKLWYQTRVGRGPFPTAIAPGVQGRYTKEHGMAFIIQNAGEHEEGREEGSTTRRPREIGYVDLPFLEHAVERSGVTHLILTKADRPGKVNGWEKIKVCIRYSLDGRPVNIDSNLMLLFGPRLEPEYTEMALDGALRGVSFSEQPGPVRRQVDLIKRRLGVEVPFISVGPVPGQVVLVDHHPPMAGVLLGVGEDQRRLMNDEHDG